MGFLSQVFSNRKAYPLGVKMRCMLKDNFKNHRSGTNVSEERFSSLPFQWGSLDTSTTPRPCATGKTSSSTSTASPPSTPLPAAPTTTTTTTRASARTLSPVSCECRAGAAQAPAAPGAMAEVDSQCGHASHLETPGERQALMFVTVGRRTTPGEVMPQTHAGSQ